MERRLRRLHSQHLEIISQVNQTYCAIILHLLLEISAYIFDLCISAPCINAPGSLCSVQSQVLCLGAVCRGWRHIALSTPRLYTVFPVCLGTPRLLGYFKIIEAWLHQLKGLPSSIYLYDSQKKYLGKRKGHSESMETYRRVDKIVDLLKEHSYRWKLLDRYQHSSQIPTCF